MRAAGPARSPCAAAASRACAAAAAVALLAGLPPAAADPGYYLVAPYDHAGKLTLEYRYWTVRPSGAPEVIWPEIGVNYGVNTRWTTGLLESWVGTSRADLKRSTLNWQNVVLLTQGEWPIDVAVWAAVAHAQNGGFANAVEWGPMLQTDFGRTQVNANIFFERTYGSTHPAPTQMKYQWQVKHRSLPGWQFGLQGFGELGDWERWRASGRQSRRIGPAASATLPGAGGTEWMLQAAYLTGKTYGTAGAMWSLRAACSF